jgi:hypothetical protein
MQLEVLDVFLPLLTDASTQASTSIAQLLGAALRTPSHRTAVAEWIPPSERGREALRGRRHWERPEAVAPAQSSGDGWLARHLTTMLRNRDVKVQEAALYALAALAKTKATSATIPQDGVRRMARIRVYNMAYLNPIHAFGPFLRVDAYHPRSSSTTKDRKLSSGAAGGGQGKEEVTPDVLGSPSSNASQPVPPIPDANDYLSPLAHADDGSDIDDVDFVPEDGGDSDDDND